MYTILINAGESAVGIFASKEEAQKYLDLKYPYSLHHHSVIKIKESWSDK